MVALFELLELMIVKKGNCMEDVNILWIFIGLVIGFWIGFFQSR